MKNKYNKTGEDSRYQGTLLGKEADQQNIAIVGGPVGSIHEWDNQLRSRMTSPKPSHPASSFVSTSPLTPMDDAFGDE
jgi:transcription initiation factor TFIID subunit 3